MPRPRPTLPTAASRPPPAPRAGTPLAAAQNAANHAPAGRKLRPLVYALGIAGIAGSGALIGAILKMSHQEEAQKVSRLRERSPIFLQLLLPPPVRWTFRTLFLTRAFRDRLNTAYVSHNHSQTSPSTNAPSRRWRRNGPIC